jgi:hypothetical protein
MGFVNRLIWTFVSPTRVFDDIRNGEVSWWQPWAWQSILYVIAGYLSQPVQRAVLALNPQDLPPDQLEQQLATMDKLIWVQLAGTPPMLILVGAALAGITYVLVTILSSSASYKKYFTITLYANIIGAVSYIVSTVVLRARGVDLIRTAQDAQVSLGLGFLAPEGNSVLYAALSKIDVFTVWSLILIGMGLMKVFDMSRGQAIACAIPWWVIAFLFTLMGQAFGGMG